MRDEKINKLGNGTPGLYFQLGGPAQNAIAGAQSIRVSMLGGKPPVVEKQIQVRTSVFVPPVPTPPPFVPDTPGDGPGGDGGAVGDNGAV